MARLRATPPAMTAEGRRRPERGVIAPFMAVVLAVVVIGMMAVAELGRLAVARADAQTAADVAALAGVHEGVAGARDLARRNGADLVAFDDRGDGVLVEVDRGGVRARARAGLRWSSAPTTPGDG